MGASAKLLADNERAEAPSVRSRKPWILQRVRFKSSNEDPFLKLVFLANAWPLPIGADMIWLNPQSVFPQVKSKMGDAGAFANQRNRVRPPDNGSFPLDHKGVCKSMRENWVVCMKTHAWDSSKCRSESVAYLRCRMDNNLMSPEEVAKLGYNDVEWDQAGLIYPEK